MDSTLLNVFAWIVGIPLAVFVFLVIAVWCVCLYGMIVLVRKETKLISEEMEIGVTPKGKRPKVRPTVAEQNAMLFKEGKEEEKEEDKGPPAPHIDIII